MKWKSLRKVIALEQTLFALPWVITGALLPLSQPLFLATGVWAQPLKWILILVAFMAARASGMAFNQLIDRDIDVKNPRTRDRVLPKGEASLSSVLFLGWGALLVFIAMCAWINTTCLLLSPFIAALILCYSYTKRFTSFCHFVLGLIEFFAPLGGWVAMTNRFGLPPLFLGLAAFALIAGTDVIYQMQDRQFDLKHNLWSFPVAFGLKKSLWVARILHVLVVICLIIVGQMLSLTRIYYGGVILIAFLFIFYHSKVDIRQLSKIPRIFFACNVQVGMVVMLFSLWDVLLLASQARLG